MKFFRFQTLGTPYRKHKIERKKTMLNKENNLKAELRSVINKWEYANLEDREILSIVTELLKELGK